VFSLESFFAMTPETAKQRARVMVWMICILGGVLCVCVCVCVNVRVKVCDEERRRVKYEIYIYLRSAQGALMQSTIHRLGNSFSMQSKSPTILPSRHF
jgi:hypothetical protein